MATQSAPEPVDETTSNDIPHDDAVDSADTADGAATDEASSTAEQPVVAVPADPAPVEAADPAPVEAAAPAAKPTVVFVQAPTPPKTRGARGVGALVALLGAGIFVAAYALLVLLIALIGSPSGFAAAGRFLSSVTFYVPVIVFFLAYLLLIVVVNRAGWWAHVLGGFVVAVITWVGFVGAAIIAAGAFGGSGTEVGSIVLQQLTNPLGFAAAIAAREVPIWVGGLVSKRGRSARVRNAEARAAYEQELAEHRSTIGGNAAV